MPDHSWRFRPMLSMLVLAAVTAAAGFSLTSCGTAPTPFVVQGPGVSGNEPPTLTITDPDENLSIDQGSNLLIRWDDTDRDSNAFISFSLVNTSTNVVIPLVDNIEENDTSGPSQLTIGTALLPIGDYNLFGIISDDVNPEVTSYAQTPGTGGAAPQRIIIKIVEPGQGPQGNPPQVTVTEPAFNRSVAQDDTITIVVQPTALPPDMTRPYDRDSPVTLYILLDTDQDPNNDDPANPDSSIIVLRQQSIIEGDFAAISIPVLIDLGTIPTRPDGEPYFIRATVDDSRNPRVHQYAVGTISVVQLAAGTVDLFAVGKLISGARFYGFTPGANLGSNLAGVGDFDADGVADFVLVAQFGNPQNRGLVGEAYGIYGLNEQRFGGSLSANSVSATISGVLFSGPPVTNLGIPGVTARTDGIVEVSFVRDLTGDGRPEILFGLPHVHGVFDSTDYDPADEDDQGPGCYPDMLVNNFSTPEQPGIPPDNVLYAGGIAVIVNSQNRDVDQADGINLIRLEQTTVDLGLVGMEAGWGQRASNNGADPIGTEPEEEGRISGARFISGGFDFIDDEGLEQGPREDLFGASFTSMGDLNNDGVDELLISAPTNERYLQDLENSGGSTGPGRKHLASTGYSGSIAIVLGTNFNNPANRDKTGDESTSISPVLDGLRNDPFGMCSAPAQSRHYLSYAALEVFAEDVDDMLGGASSARDFNQDGLDDVLCGAPSNDRSALLSDSGAVYVLYGRPIAGDYFLFHADDPVLRPPMLRIRGASAGDQIGTRQSSALDVNGDRIDDILFSSPTADFGGVTRTTCAGDFNGDGVINNRDLDSAGFAACQQSGAVEVFAGESCKAFDYDSNGRIDTDDETVFLCLLQGAPNCCANLVNNGFIGVIFGGVFIDGDRIITQLGTSDLPGATFFGSGVGHRAGTDVSSAGDFNQDGFGDILIAVPGESRLDVAGRTRQGVVYLVFGGTHLTNRRWNLNQVGSEDLPGIVFLSPYVAGRPNEAAPIRVGFIGDINNDGFGDIAIGNPRADFIDLNFPQGPDATDASVGRRRNAGDVYIIYGNNFGSNRNIP